MSADLLQRVKGHIIDTGGLLSAYSVRYYRWTDADINGSGSIALFRISGTGGEAIAEYQMHDVSLFLLSSPASVTQADSDMLGVLRYLRQNFYSVNVRAYYPVQSYTGPTYLQNGRAMFEMVIRCGVEDH